MKQEEQPMAAHPPEEGALASSWMSASVRDGFTVVAVGDLILSDALCRRLEQSAPDLLALIRGADVAFGNFEGTAIDLRKFGGHPSALSGGSWLVSTPAVPADLGKMGFDLVSLANNHSTDWGVEGMRYTSMLFEQAGVVHAGTGETLSQARAPSFLATGAGRVSLVALASRFEANARAIDPLGQIPGRPGLNALRTTRIVLVSPERLKVLEGIRDALPKGMMRRSILETDRKNGTVTLFDVKYRAREGLDENAVEFTFNMDERDRKGILHNIRQAKQTSDFSIVSMHTHEPGNYCQTPPDFMPTIARQAVDNGADAFIGHGPHQLRGIEIYRGRPIYYSLGNFFFMENQQQPITRDEYEKDKVEPMSMTEAEFMEHRRVHGVFKEQIWYESVVAVNRYQGNGELARVELHPIEMHWEGGRDADRGIPRIARGADALRILERLQRLSRAYGTGIVIRDDVGHIALR
ncbi:MAG: poly-gamma-glutamate biosynthesis protein [Bordetella sp. SCN 67-23]|nr:CapA family protein [Burkholderiales bacterium]ODS73842.1 MAG: poly-gamma-glutamate biosynthesis protein [Bordetella sp. SCN 67-23]ODU67386.1 MAG: poly-gamma-glutamate biosynthesis protein [Bordetella sp. SCN 68-11]OJW92703.1 MAG: poly-gamma-glutamate biosynthesis protein [Burkholderiales bacterium 67-32]